MHRSLCPLKNQALREGAGFCSFSKVIPAAADVRAFALRRGKDNGIPGDYNGSDASTASLVVGAAATNSGPVSATDTSAAAFCAVVIASYCYDRTAFNSDGSTVAQIAADTCAV